MTSSPATQSIRVGLGRSNVVIVICTVLFLGIISVVSIVGSLRDPNAPLGFFIGGLFGAVLVYFLIKMGPFLRPRSFEFAPDGFRFWHGEENAHIPWEHVLAIGVGYEKKPEDPEELTVPLSLDDVVDMAKERISGELYDRITEVLHVSDKRRLGLEIFPRSPELFGAYPRLRPYVKRQDPPAAKLPGEAWRLPLPPVASIAREASRGAEAFHPAGWLGWYVRDWDEPKR